MKCVLVLEDEQRAAQGIHKILTSIDPKILIRSFTSLEDLYFWFEKSFVHPDEEDQEYPGVRNELAKFAKLDRDRIEEVILFIMNHRILGPNQYRLAQKLGKYFITRNYGGDRRRVGMIFTAHESEAIDPSDYSCDIFDNIIYKPFDHDVAVEKIKWAINPEEASKGQGLHRQKPRDRVEMLKQIDIETISALGFSTTSEKEIPTGSIGRYHGAIFGDSFRNGFYAKCVGSAPSPTEPGKFNSSFNYFALPPRGISEIRKLIDSKEDKQSHAFPIASPDEFVSAIILDEDPPIREFIEHELLQQYINVSVCSHGNLIDFLLDLDPSVAASEIYSDVEDEESFFRPVVFTTDPTGQHIYNIDTGDQPLPLGFSREDLNSIKSKLMAPLDSEQRKEFNAYWRQDITDPFTFAYKLPKEQRFYTLLSSKTVKDDDREQRVVEIRYALPEEIKASQKSSSSIQPNTAVIFLSQKMVMKRDAGFWNDVVEKLRTQDFLYPLIERPRIIVLSKDIGDPHVAADAMKQFDDIIQTPIDARYLMAKLSSLMPYLRVIDKPVTINYLDTKTKGFSSIIPKVKHISEVGLAIAYKRPLDLDQYRYFIVEFPEIEQQPKLLAKCVLHEEIPGEKGRYLNHFTFFGLSEQYNFMLRNWLMEQYALNKQEEEKAAEQA